MRHDFALKPGEISQSREHDEKKNHHLRQRDDPKRMLRR
jgi:hypothetical protein